mmetsp:Transcript_89637/g.254105  ORF Transcript_89637/g.254105 Transcript_89637/m.254105 type:complete len:240 (+) Transcript_89637:657-1376(+)
MRDSTRSLGQRRSSWIRKSTRQSCSISRRRSWHCTQLTSLSRAACTRRLKMYCRQLVNACLGMARKGVGTSRSRTSKKSTSNAGGVMEQHPNHNSSSTAGGAACRSFWCNARLYTCLCLAPCALHHRFTRRLHPQRLLEDLIAAYVRKDFPGSRIRMRGTGLSRGMRGTCFSLACLLLLFRVRVVWHISKFCPSRISEDGPFVGARYFSHAREVFLVWHAREVFLACTVIALRPCLDVC